MQLRIYLYNNLVSDIRELREEIFVKELGFESISDDNDKGATFVLLYDDKTPIATGRTYHKDGQRIIDQVCVKKAYRNKKIGKRVVAALEEDISKDGIYESFSCSLTQTVGFYEKLEYVNAGTGENGGYVYLKKALKPIVMH